MPLNLFRREKSLGEIEDEGERLQAENEKAGTELSLMEKRVAIAQLKKRGLTSKHFGMDWGRIWKFLKSDSLLAKKRGK